MIRIFSEQLPQSLNNRLASIYYLVGQDPLLQQESADIICHTAFTQGFDEKYDLTIDHLTDWQALFERVQSMGLFFNRQIIRLHLPENLSVPIQQHLLTLMQSLHADVLLVLHLSKLTKAMEKQAWFTMGVQIEPDVTLINCQTPSVDQLPRWIANRAQNMQLAIDNEATQFLCYSYENNLLALKQALQLLALLYPNDKVTLAKVRVAVEQSSIFTPFQWIDALLEGKYARAKRILQGLQAEDVQPVVLLRTLQRELMTLLTLTQPQQRLNSLQDPLPTAQLREQFDRLKVWQNRRPLFTQCIQRLNYRQLYVIIQHLAKIERKVKMEFSDEVWNELAALSMQIAHPTR
ncbi:DNA polymerase III subunit delta [[Pasteurella] aerogenes]|nr:DNA polymerase III subunit delta [[Pasteurella] aerogenes]